MFTQVATQSESGYEGSEGGRGRPARGLDTACGGSYYMFSTHLGQQQQNSVALKGKYSSLLPSSIFISVLLKNPVSI